MSILQSILSRIFPPSIRKTDPDFGPLFYQRVPRNPAKSYWEAAEWVFPPTGEKIFVGLDGPETGPLPEFRDFYLSRAREFDKIMALVRPKLSKVFREWLNQELPQDIFSVVKLSGFDVESLAARPLEWSVSFETTGDKWLHITIPFVGDTAEDASIDT